MEGFFAIVAPRVHHGNTQLPIVLDGRRPLVPERAIGDQLIAGTADRATGALRIHRSSAGLKGRAMLREATAALATRSHPFVAANGLHLLLTDDELAASRLLLPAIFSALPLRGRPVVAAPHGGMVIAAGEDDREALARLCAMAGQAFRLGAGWLLSPAPLVLEGEDWSPWVPPEGHALTAAVRDLRLRTLGFAYDAQRRALARLASERADIPTVASLQVATGPTGARQTRTTWTDLGGKGEDHPFQLLPLADAITFSPSGRGPVAMAEVGRVCKTLLKRLETDPPLLRARGFPSEGMLRRLGP